MHLMLSGDAVLIGGFKTRLRWARPLITGGCRQQAVSIQPIAVVP